jgi:2-epi-5-epi-valiolone synthase
VKIALVRDDSLFTMVESFGPALIASGFREHAEVGQFVIGRSIELMLEELEPNCFEDRGYRRLVDFGHTFSPLLEAKSGYRIAHGEAVAIDMAMSSTIAMEMGLLDQQSCRRIVTLLQRLGLPVQSTLADAALMRQAMLDATLHRDGSVNLVVPTSVGSADFVTSHGQVTDAILHRAGKAVAHLAEFEEGIRVPSYS